MDDMAAYYPPPPPSAPATYTYYQPPSPPQPQRNIPQPPPPGTAAPYAVHAPPYVPYHGTHDEVRTLFVAGFPEDVKAREIYNLFREFPGYESSHFRSASESNQSFAFAVFADQQSAVAAMHALNGMVFDLEMGSTLYINFAKSNPRAKRLRTHDERPGSDKKARGFTAFSRDTPDTGMGSIHLPRMGSSAHNTIGYPPTQRAGNARAASKPICKVTDGNAEKGD